jgi:hypothetical protein
MSSSSAIPQPRRAEKKRVKIKVGVQGPSGSGKTWGALAMARNMWPDAKICLIDTENESASLYADQFEFDTIPLTPPFTSARYQQCIEMIVRQGYEVGIIDTITHQWDGEGGILRRKEQLDQRPGSNSWANWSQFTPEHQAFIESIKQAPIHIIATMRTKQDYVLEQSDKGKTKPVKVGMAPIVREGTDYEFSIVFDVQMDHKAMVSKNRTAMFEGEVLDLASVSVAERLRAWLDNGADVKGPEAKSWSSPTPQGIHEPQKQRASRQPAAPATPQPQATPSTDPKLVNRPWGLTGDILKCMPLKSELMERDGKKFVAVKLNGHLGEGAMAFCFAPNLFGAVLNTTDHLTVLRVDLTGQYPYITDVIEIAGHLYKGGLPVTTRTQDNPTREQPDQHTETNPGGHVNAGAVNGDDAGGSGESAAAPMQEHPSQAEVEKFWADGEQGYTPAKPAEDPLGITDDDLPDAFWSGEESK